MTTRFALLPLFALSLFAIAGCQTTAPEANPRPHDAPAGPGLFSGDSGNLLDSFKSGNGGVLSGQSAIVGGTGMAANVNLWRAALNVVSILPLAQTDSAGGVIITEWANVPNTTPQEQIKVNIAITGNALSADALNTNVFKRVQGDNGWNPLPNDTAAADKLKTAILTKARTM